MPFFIPALAIGAGGALIAWGAKMFYDNNDSADQVAKEFLAKIPSEIREKIDSVEISPSGVKFNFKKEVSLAEQERIKKEIKRNVKVKKEKKVSKS